MAMAARHGGRGRGGHSATGISTPTMCIPRGFCAPGG
jgi:hypothetical protein